MITHCRQTISVVEAATGAVLQQLDQFLLVRRLIAKRPALAADQRCRDQLLHGFVLQQLGQFGLGQLRQFIHQLLERGVTHGRTVQILCFIQFDGAAPVACRAQHPRLFTEAGNTQLQRIAETVDAQLPGLAERITRLFQRLDRIPPSLLIANQVRPIEYAAHVLRNGR